MIAYQMNCFSETIIQISFRDITKNKAINGQKYKSITFAIL